VLLFLLLFGLLLFFFVDVCWGGLGEKGRGQELKDTFSNLQINNNMFTDIAALSRISLSCVTVCIIPRPQFVYIDVVTNS